MGVIFCGWQRKAACILLVAAFSIACATTAKRFSEDLQKDGFTISGGNAEETASVPTVAVTDVDSSERLLQWFRNQPRASGELETALAQQVMHDVKSPTIIIETPRFRVTIPYFDQLFVVLETRNSSAGEWKQASWKMRKEDSELRQWALSHLIQEYARMQGEEVSEPVPATLRRISN